MDTRMKTAAAAAAAMLGALLLVGCAAVAGARPSRVPAEDSVVTIRGVEPSEAPAAPLDRSRSVRLGPPDRGAAVAFRDFSVPVRWRLYDSCRRWVAFADIDRPLARERIVLMDAVTGTWRVVLRRPVSRRPALGVTDVRVSDSWLAWEETSPYDIELGPAARWRIYAARIEPGPRLGPVRLVDEGVVGRRPRCALCVAGSSVVYGLTEVLRTDRATARPTLMSARLVSMDAATGARRVLASYPGAIDAVAVCDTGFIVTRRGGPAAEVRVCVAAGRDATAAAQAALPAGADTVRSPAAGVGGVALSVLEAPGDEPRLYVADRALRVRWTGPPGSQDPVVAGGHVVYRIARQRGSGSRGPDSSLVLLDPATGRQRAMASAGLVADGLWVLASGGRDARHVWAMLDRSVEAIEAGRTRSIVRRFDLGVPSPATR